MASTASKTGSGLSTMPGPPPYGVSSTVRRRSWAKSRRLTISISTNPFSQALLIILLEKGPVDICGNRVRNVTRKSISLIYQPGRQPHFQDPGGQINRKDYGF